jgi:hypothetical protein
MNDYKEVYKWINVALLITVMIMGALCATPAIAAPAVIESGFTTETFVAGLDVPNDLTFDPSSESLPPFIVTIGENKVFTTFNVDRISGTANSDGQNASSYVKAGPYQSGISEAWAGVRFQVVESPNGLTTADAIVSITFKYKLKVDFNVLSPTEGGGGSADARLYGWIANYKKELDYINFIHSSNFDEKSGTITFTHRLSDSPTWINLYAGQTYEVTADIYTHADVYKGYDALSYAEVTLQKVTIDFGKSQSPNCDSAHLNLCTNQSDCEGAYGYWYEDMCHSSSPSPPGLIYACDRSCETQCENLDIACIAQCSQYQESCCEAGVDVCNQSCGPVLEPPQKHTVGMCNSTCQEAAPIQVSGGQADICFNYLRPVTALAGFMSPDFTTVWWLDEN